MSRKVTPEGKESMSRRASLLSQKSLDGSFPCPFPWPGPDPESLGCYDELRGISGVPSGTGTGADGEASSGLRTLDGDQAENRDRSASRMAPWVM